MKTRNWKVGDLAKVTGLSVRTLHYYEEIELLIPSARTESDHRVYSEKDLARLQQILSLKQLGLPLEDVKSCLAEKKMSALQIIKAHKQRVFDEKGKIEKLYTLLSNLENALEKREVLSVEALIETMEATIMFEKYFTKEQLEQLAERRTSMGEEKMKAIENAWPKLIEAVRAEMKAGTDPNSPSVQVLAKQWSGLVEAFTGGDVHIGLGLRDMYRNEPQIARKNGMDPELNEYVAKMMYCMAKGDAKAAKK